ncbi:metallophosphatase family protein [Dyadobacter chenwenxiniae]|uniref:Metallophosphatase family protein n=1 Tax=Dyadobacter chenwenxiniae TaxID=2906456 RepID=A0A9X1TD73_9BACT|nr:metallophosphoesterase family protein [Dyadobacter chenwenxiniae]MCF0060444.1 metallophosphatase family protein [Dyadobacter chenwenxiniae]UON86175.1 metallophosphatase family protein [Dyadobacter chenwenxiniae]
MKIALLSDIHANLPAFEAVLEDLEKQQPDAVYCLGDLVGYNVWPNQVISLVRKHGIATIAGNHDLKVSKILPSVGECSKEENSDYAYKLVGNKERDFLLTLPRHLRLEFQLNDQPLHMLLVHGSPRRINEYLLQELPEQYMLELVKEFKADILCFGHSHRPYHRVINSGENGIDHFHHLVNTGSVGKPKDGDVRACYVLIMIDQMASIKSKDAVRVEFIRVKYDVEKAAQAVELSLLPDALADNLRKAY